MRRTTAVSLAAILAFPAVAVAAVSGSSLPADVHEQLDAQKQDRAAQVQDASIPSTRMSGVPCEDGAAGPFPCDGVDLLSFVPAEEFAGQSLAAPAFAGISDVWGWTDPLDGGEYVILGVDSGPAFFNVTDPENPVFLGQLRNTAALQLIWHDIKVHDNHAFIVSESNVHGMRVFDLTRLRGLSGPPAVPFTPDATYLGAPGAEVNAVHNVVINEETGYAYLVGTNTGILLNDACSRGGLHMVDISDPTRPEFAGCYADDGYTHDAQCVVYRGPDADYAGREICVNSNEDSVHVVDVTDKANPQPISDLTYPQVAYTHQGWFTEDQSHFLVGDELDEQDSGLPTRTMILDLTDLDAPRLAGEHLHDTAAIDHNMYTRDGLVFQSNYAAGLRVLSTADVASGTLTETAFFDTFPAHDEPEFVGTWSNYPYFESGTIAVSGIDEGLFLLRLTDDPADAEPEASGPGNGKGGGKGGGGSRPGTGNGRS